MEIDPAALSRTTTTIDTSVAPSALSKPLTGTSKDAQKSKAPPVAPRVDLEPFYTEIKASIGDNWATYKDSVSQFILGYLNQAELSSLIEHFILIDPYRENLHNQLMCGIYANVYRDTPDAGVASWVSANDKPSNAPKPPTGDAADQRLKHEIKQLLPRMRHRIKTLKDDPPKPLTTTLITQAHALTLHHPHGHHPSAYAVTESSSSASGAGLNRDLEIRRRYREPLISETHDLPAATALSDRILPICYEEGLPSGLSNGEMCSDLLSTALGIFVKDFITGIVSKTRCNAPVSGPKPDIAIASHVDSTHVSSSTAYGSGLDRTGMGIMTAGYKKRLREEEKAWHAGEVKRSDAGLLPVEVIALSEPGRGKSAPGDLRLAFEIDDTWMRALAPWQGEKIVVDGQYRWGEDGGEEDSDGRRRKGGHSLGDVESRLPLLNGTGSLSGINGFHEEPVGMDEEDWGWHGARQADQKTLGSLLDDCLNIES